MYPNRGKLTVQIILSRVQVAAAEKMKLPPHVSRVLESARKYPEGRWLFIPVRSKKSAEGLRDLIALKMSRPGKGGGADRGASSAAGSQPVPAAQAASPDTVRLHAVAVPDGSEYIGLIENPIARFSLVNIGESAMTHRRLRTLLLLVTLVVVTHGLLAQGLYYETVFKGGPLKDNVTKTYLMPKMMKSVNADDKDFMVLRLDQQKMISVDTKAKTYWTKTFAEMQKSMKAAAGKMDQQLAGLQEKMKEMPKEQREMMEKMMGSRMGGKAGDVQMTRTKETRKISGFTCTKYVAKEGTKELMTIWATTEIKGFEPLMKDYEELARQMTSMNPTFAKGLIDAMSKIEGFPIQTDWGEMSTVVTKVEQRSTPESEFAVPAGYRLTQPPMGEE
jgi:GLPGLI family protein